MKNTRHLVTGLTALAALAFSTGALADGPDGEKTDHEGVVGHFGVGYMGMMSAPIYMPDHDGTGAGTNTMKLKDTLSVPAAGVRYWLDPMLGVEFGIGLNLSGGSVTDEVSATGKAEDKGEQTFDLTESTWALALRAGVPLSLYSGKHYSFQVVPAIYYSLASYTARAPIPTLDEPWRVQDQVLSTWTLGIGAEAGAEIQFGFMGIPELSVQGGLGLQFNYSHSAQTFKPNPVDDAEKVYLASGQVWSINTFADGEPWDIFTGTVRALYYF